VFSGEAVHGRLVCHHDRDPGAVILDLLPGPAPPVVDQVVGCWPRGMASIIWRQTQAAVG